jgi:hypothetical protein
MIGGIRGAGISFVIDSLRSAVHRQCPMIGGMHSIISIIVPKIERRAAAVLDLALLKID